MKIFHLFFPQQLDNGLTLILFPATTTPFQGSGVPRLLEYSKVAKKGGSEALLQIGIHADVELLFATI